MKKRNGCFYNGQSCEENIRSWLEAKAEVLRSAFSLDFPAYDLVTVKRRFYEVAACSKSTYHIKRSRVFQNVISARHEVARTIDPVLRVSNQ